MTGITATVGKSGVNVAEDVILVQAMLQAIRNANGRPYYNSNYDGVFGPITERAIADFQRDHGLFQLEFGHVTMGGQTLRTMLQLLPSDRRDMRVMPGTRTVYLGAPRTLLSSVMSRLGAMTFNPNFGTKVRTLIDEMFRMHEIVLTINDKTGHFRTFQEQASLGTTVGPGESFHNYGLAADVLFNPLKFIKPDGVLMDGGNPVLNNLETLNRMTWLKFWEARDTIATRNGLFPIGTSDRPHLQSVTNRSPGRSFVTLLNSRGTMRWDFRPARPNIYKCDLGFGKVLVEVGSAKDIWLGQARVTTSNIATALGVQPSSVNPGAVAKVQKALRDEFVWAENHWQSWKPM